MRTLQWPGVGCVLLVGWLALACAREKDLPNNRPPLAMRNLQDFRARNKFADAEWAKRGLHPAESHLSARLNGLFNACTDELLREMRRGGREPMLRQVLLTGLGKFDSSGYDTAEKEFIIDHFTGLSELVQVDIKSELSAWRYGTLLNTMRQTVEVVQGPEEIIETHVQACTRCQVPLKTLVLEKQDGLPSAGFAVAQCLACEELNLIEIRSDVKRFRFDNYRVRERLDGQAYAPDQALARLEQLREQEK